MLEIEVRKMSAPINQLGNQKFDRSSTSFEALFKRRIEVYCMWEFTPTRQKFWKFTSTTKMGDQNR